nr:unnamed protein product [Callosobruchus analis]
MYKPKQGEPFYVGLKSLELIWMCKPYPKDERLLVYIFRMAVGLSLIIFLQVGPILHILMVASAYESISMSEALSHLVGGFGFSLVYFKMSLYHHRCSAVFKDLVDHKKFGKPRTFNDTARRCRILAVFFLMYCPVCLLIYESTFILISHIEFLLDHLDAAFCEKDQKRRIWMLKYCIQYHIHISKMSKGICSLHETFTGHMAVIWAGSLGCICNQMLHSKLLAALLYLLGYLFTCCCLSESLADKLYNTPWYLGTIDEQKYVTFMIRRAQVPMRLPATPFGNYDFTFFIMILKLLKYSLVTANIHKWNVLLFSKW